MKEYISVIFEDYELLDENFYYERYYDMNIKHSKISKTLKFTGVYNINYVKLEEAIIDKSKNHIYIFYKPSFYKLKEIESFFSKKLTDAVNNHSNIFILLFNGEEILAEENLHQLCDYLKKDNISEDKFILYTNNSNLDFIIKKNGYKMRFIKSSGLIKNFAEKFGKYEIEFLENKKFLFLTQNKRFKIHRFALLSFLHNKDLLSITDWSFLENPMYESKNCNYEDFVNIIDSEDHQIVNNFTNYISQYPYKKNFYESDIPIDDFSQITLINKTFFNSYINLTTETLFFETDIHVTEKSYKPFYNYQFPIMIASHNHIKIMKESHNYDFFDDLIDHSYDNEPNNKLRLKMIFNEIVRLSNMKDEIVEFYVKNKNRFEHNKKITENLKHLNDSESFYKI